MAIPASGNISIKGTAGACRSICAAVVQGGGTPSGSLLALNEDVYPKITPPGEMSQFYGYNPVSTLSVDVTIDWYGGYNFNDGWGGTVRLMCGASQVAATCTVTQYVKYDEWVWTGIAAGTYCVNFTLLSGYCNGGGLFVDKCWNTDTSSGVGNVTNTFSDNEVVYLGGYP